MDKNKTARRITQVLIALLVTYSTPGLTQNSIEDYGLLPKLRSIKISPDGEHYAFIQRQGTDDTFLIINAKTREMVGGSKIDGWKARYVYFATNNHVVLRATKTDREAGYKHKFERGVAFVFNIKTGKLKTLLNRTPGLHKAQSGMGRIVGVSESKNEAYMPAFDDGQFAAKNLYKVSFKTGMGKLYEKGNQHTIDWFVGEEGKILAREDYSNQDHLHRIFAYQGKERKIIYENKTPIRKVYISAVSEDEKHLIYSKDADIYKMSLLDGTIIQLESDIKGYDLGYLDTDIGRKLVSVHYSGLQPFDDLQDPLIASRYRGIEATFPDSQVSFISSAFDGKKILVQVHGNDAAGSYMLYDSENNSIIELGRLYPTVNKSDIGKMTTITYKARDGLKIPTILTWPVGVETKEQKTDLPLLVFPHGGPASYSAITFDWWAQYFARQGYAILQPNFRGSSAFGKKHEKLGNGKWGREMQDDLSDGVKAVVKAGYVDPDRICIMGSSYGGYAALAGGAFSPELYRCVIAVGAVSDLPRMLNGKADRYGENHWVIRYWNKLIGDTKAERDKLKSISPVNFSNDFKAPVLLIHGNNDTVVPRSQSSVMHKALIKAGKDSTLVMLKGEDHWLSTSNARLQMLKEVDAFLAKHNPI